MPDFLVKFFADIWHCGRWRPRYWLLGLIALWAGLTVPSVQAQENLTNQILVYQDPSGQLDPGRLESLKPDQWKPPPRHLNFGATRNVIWLRLDLIAPLPERPRLWLMRSNLEHVCLYSYLSGNWQEHCEGSREPLVDSDFLSSNLVFRLTSPVKRYYLKVSSSNLIFLPLSLQSSRDFQVNIQNKLLLDMMFLGAILVILLYNLLLYLRLRNPAYLFYVLFGVTSSLFFFGFLFGYSRLLPQNLHDLIRDSAFTLSMLSSVFLIESMLGLIPFQAESPNSYRLIRILQIMLMILTLLTLTRQWQLTLVSVLLKTYVMPLVVTALLALLVSKGNRIARIYLAAWSLLSVSGWTLALMYQGVIPYLSASTTLVSLTYILSFLAFALVLVEQLHLLNQEKSQLLSASLDLTQTHNRELEARVQQRTTQLQSSLATVEALNQSKNRLFSILAHDLRSPFASLKLMMVLFEKKDVDLSKLETLMPRLRRQVDGIYASLENMLEWARTEMQGGTEPPERIDLGLLLLEVREMYSAAAHQKQIVLEIEPGSEAEIMAQKHQIRLILRNLVNNAVKFTPSGGRVSLHIARQDREIRLRVQDTGVGMTQAQSDALFASEANLQIQAGTEGERGIGLGLQLCRSYLEQMNARLDVKSEPDHGTIFELCFNET